MKRLLILAAVLVTWANSAGAAIFVTFTGAAPDPLGWDWTYLVTLQPDQTMRVGDFATIYDVPDIASPGIFNPTFGSPIRPATDFTVTTPLLGLTPGAPPDLADDDPLIKNVSVQLTGGGNIVGDPTASPITIGTLHIKSTSNVPITTDYQTIAQAKGGLGDSITSATVVVAVGQIPEPGSLTLMMVGLLAVGGLAYKRRQV